LPLVNLDLILTVLYRR
jgi:hypothetical protein